MPKKTKPASQNNYFFLGSVITVIVLLSLALVSLDESFARKEKAVLGLTTEVAQANNPKEEGELAFWRDFVQKQPQYQQGWIEIAKFSALTGNTSQLKVALTKLREINPNLEEITTYEKSLGD